MTPDGLRLLERAADVCKDIQARLLLKNSKLTHQSNNVVRSHRDADFSTSSDKKDSDFLRLTLERPRRLIIIMWKSLQRFDAFIHTWTWSTYLPAVTKIIWRKILDLIMRLEIRSRLAAIERTLKFPHIFYNPTKDKEWKMMLGAYQDLFWYVLKESALLWRRQPCTQVTTCNRYHLRKDTMYRGNSKLSHQLNDAAGSHHDSDFEAELLPAPKRLPRAVDLTAYNPASVFHPLRMASAHWNELDDSSSVCGSFFSASTLSFAHGPGALTGGFLKFIGEKGLDLIVRVVVRSRLAAIERTLETSPHIFYNPTEKKEWKMMLGAYRDLRELCREFRSGYYSSYFQNTAARLVRDITYTIQSAPQDSFTKGWDSSLSTTLCLIFSYPHHLLWMTISHEDLAGVGRWEELLAHVQHRWGVIVTRTVEISHHGTGTFEVSDVSTRSPWISNNGNDQSNFGIGLDRPMAGHENRRDSQRMSNIFKYPEKLPGGSFPANQFATRKVLVLGAGAVGKSSLLEQIIETFRSNPYSEVYLSHFPLSQGEESIIANAMHAIRDVFKTYVSPSDLAEDRRDLFEQFIDNDFYFPPYGFRDAIRILWNDPVVQRSVLKFRTRNQSQSLHAPEGGFLSFESTCYFLDNAHRVLEENYYPTQEDRIRGKYAPTDGVWEFRCHEGSILDGIDWLFVDTGGARSQRSRWKYCFEGTSAVLFVVALSDYNKWLPEDPKVNSLQESLDLFKDLLRSESFEHTTIVLFFNKVDVFSQAVRDTPLQDYFPEATTNGHLPPWYCNQFSTCEEELESVGNLFRSIAEKCGKEIYIAYGSAVNSHVTKETWISIKDKIDVGGAPSTVEQRLL